MYPAAGNELQWWRDPITPNIGKNKEQLFLFAKTKQRSLLGRSDQITSSFCTHVSIVFTYTVHRYLFYFSIFGGLWGCLRCPGGACQGFISAPSYCSNQIQPAHPAACDCCPAAPGITQFPWGVHFWQGAGMKPLSGLPWHCG